jgi:hypothetical protein
VFRSQLHLSLRAIQEKGTCYIPPVKEKMNIQEILIITKRDREIPRDPRGLSRDLIASSRHAQDPESSADERLEEA